MLTDNLLCLQSVILAGKNPDSVAVCSIQRHQVGDGLSHKHRRSVLERSTCRAALPSPCTPSRDARCVLKDCSKDTLWSPWVPIICCSVAIVAGSEGPISNTTTATNAHAQSCRDTAVSACRRLRPGRKTFFNSSVFSLSQHESSPTDSHVRHCVRSGRPPSAINAGVSVFETPVELSLVEGMAGRNRHVDLQVLQNRGS